VDRIRILTVCSGNICRSPLAQLMIAERLADLPEYVVGSAGTIARDGDPMPEPARALARRYGVVPESHTARYLTEDMVAESDLVLALARSHRSTIVQYAPGKVSRTFTLREFARLAASLSDDQITAAAGADTVKERVDAVIARVFAQKASAGLASSPEADDVVDPYRRSDSTYTRSGEEIVPAVEQVARVLRLAATRSDGAGD
jgi:protein-tyrosine phosphatase